MLHPLLAIAAGAVTALALWPFTMSARPVVTITPAPLVRDYATRDQLIAFYERQVRVYPRDQIQMRMLAQQYMQRFREQFDFKDVDRARGLAERSIALQPQGNTSAQMTLASTLMTYHDFNRALVHEREAWHGDPSNAGAQAQIASLQMELGQYDMAHVTLANIGYAPSENPNVDAVRARYEELTGNLPRARSLIASASRSADSDVSDPAYDRSWYHLRAGQLAFEAGDAKTAQLEYATALDDFPQNAVALMWEARLYLNQGAWQKAFDAADRSCQLYPLPQALGYKADAQRALHDELGARATDALIDAEGKLFNAQGVNDRLLANYYAERGTHLAEALRAAASDFKKRGNEVYADGTMAWTLARMGRWKEAFPFAERSVRLGTQDASLQFHMGVIALHNGNAHLGRRYLHDAAEHGVALPQKDLATAQSGVY